MSMVLARHTQTGKRHQVPGFSETPVIGLAYSFIHMGVGTSVTLGAKKAHASKLFQHICIRYSDTTTQTPPQHGDTAVELATKMPLVVCLSVQTYPCRIDGGLISRCFEWFTCGNQRQHSLWWPPPHLDGDTVLGAAGRACRERKVVDEKQEGER